ncbi:MAG: SLC13 family permease [Candidatus Zixiibacteriota bacterium]
MTAHATGGVAPPRSESFRIGTRRFLSRVDPTKLIAAGTGIGLFVLFLLVPGLPDAVDPAAPGHLVPLPREGRLAIGLFLLTATWWVFEVIPVGITAVAVVAAQALFAIARPGAPPTKAFTDFFDPAVWFIFGSLLFGMVFSKTGLTRRLTYRMVGLMGERTSLIYLGSFLMVFVLTLFMMHTAAAAISFPLLMAVYSLYEESERPTRFGKGLFIGMAHACACGSLVTYLGSARAAIAARYYAQVMPATLAEGHDPITFGDLAFYMLPLGLFMVLALWVLVMILFKPERPSIPGLRERARQLSQRLGPVSAREITSLVIVLGTVFSLLLLPSSADSGIDRSVIILTAVLLFFLLRILSIDDLEKVPWSIMLLFGGSLSLGLCLWETGASRWMALHLLPLFRDHHPLLFVLVSSLAIMIMTNLLVNVAVIALCLPVALTVALYLGVSGEVVLYSSLAAAGMPLLLLIGAAPNVMAYQSKMFTPREFFGVGPLASAVVMGILTLFVVLVWPILGMPTFPRG